MSLPSAALERVADHIVLQPPLSRRGTGPGIVVFLPLQDPLDIATHTTLDPEPVLKWAEEGFAVAAVTISDDIDIMESINKSISALKAHTNVDVKDNFGIIVYANQYFYSISEVAAENSHIGALVGYGAFSSPRFAGTVLQHLTANIGRPRFPPTASTTQYSYDVMTPLFVLPSSTGYDPTNAALAHSRTLGFLRKALGGPFFDLEAIWEEHTYFEFSERSVERTMATMVAEPYVNHVPTMTGGIGRENLTAFYRDHFIFSNPEDAKLQTVSRTVGLNRVVDEFIYHFTHDRQLDWLLPGVPPTHKKISVPMMAVVNIRGDRLSNEHIWWDQATVLRQAGILPTHLPNPQIAGENICLPVAGVEVAHKLLDPSAVPSNEMLKSD